MATKLHKYFNRPMTELELIYNAASLKDGTLNGHYAGLCALVEHGRALQRREYSDKIINEIIERATK